MSNKYLEKIASKIENDRNYAVPVAATAGGAAAGGFLAGRHQLHNQSVRASNLMTNTSASKGAKSRGAAFKSSDAYRRADLLDKLGKPLSANSARQDAKVFREAADHYYENANKRINRIYSIGRKGFATSIGKGLLAGGALGLGAGLAINKLKSNKD